MVALGFCFLHPEKGCDYLVLALGSSLISRVGVDKVLNFYCALGHLFSFQYFSYVINKWCPPTTRLGVNVVLRSHVGRFSISVLAVVLNELVCSKLEHWVDLR